MKRKLLLVTMMILALAGAMVSCYFDATRDNPNDPESDNYGSTIYMFATGNQPNGALGNRNTVDTLCKNTRETSYNKLPSKNIHAFISYNSSDSIANMPTLFHVPTKKPILSHNGSKLADNWQDLLDGSIAISLSGAGISTTRWWSGSNSDGTVHANTCLEWTQASGTNSGAYGDSDVNTSKWLGTGMYMNCDYEPRVVLCICWE